MLSLPENVQIELISTFRSTHQSRVARPKVRCGIKTGNTLIEQKISA